MTPYGIVYKENIYAFEESIRVWQKKFGVLKLSTFIKISAVLWALAAVITVALYLLGIDAIYAVIYIVLTVITNIFVWIGIRNGYIKQISKANYQPTEKQIVLFDDRMEITTGYGKGTYFYDEILMVYERNSIITIILDSGATPYCVSMPDIKKGDYRIFTQLLKEKTAPVYVSKGGAV